MQPASSDASAGRTQMTQLKRWGPLGLLVVVTISVVALVLSGGGGDDDGTAPATSASPAPTTAAGDSPGATEASDAPAATTEAAPTATTQPLGTDYGPDTGLRPGVMSWEVAQDLGLDVAWGERCDTERGRLAIPSFFAAACFAPYEGWNGGATDRGVTEDTIRIAWWIPQEVDFIMLYLTSAIANDDTNPQEIATMEGLIEYYESYYETYGRNVELHVVQGSGLISDEAAARADAVKIAEDIDPFMVWAGPGLTSAFAQELAARGIPCISCGPGQSQQYYEDNAGLAYTLGKGPDQLDTLVAEYVGKRLLGDNAIHAGDPGFRNQERVFGRIWIQASAASSVLNEHFEEVFASYGGEIAESQSYVLDPGTLQESAATVIARMKEAGVTSVIFNGDPIAPREFTNEAAAQDYWPEWIVTGSVLVDTAAFSRTYHQEQWANAFGISNLSARVNRRVASSYAIYEWFHAEEPPADDTIGVIDPVPALFYAVLQAVGPNLTVEGFHEALFDGEPTARALTAPSLSYGVQGIWGPEYEPDYRGVDDVAEVWWDSEAEGPDEIDRDGTGLWRFVNGGQRYKPGEIPEGPPAAFVLDGTVTIYDSPPPGEERPEYEPLHPG